MTVVGTRPEAIKLAPLILALAGHPLLRPVVVTTGQHRGVVDEVLDIFDIDVHADLGVGECGPDLDGIAGAVLTRFGALLRADRPGAVVVQGDTTSVLGAALAAFYQRIPVVHLEAGLRSDDRLAPYPEEVHRRATALLADVHLAPTRDAARRLRAEGVPDAAVHLTGNTVVDALHHIRVRAAPYRDARLTGLHATIGAVVLVTAHRRESWGEPLEQVVRAVERIALARPALTVVVSMHPNPLVRKTFAPLVALGNVVLTEPEPYPAFVRLMHRADLILTDSGGIQEEAPSLGTPVLVLRERTERMEGVRAGVARLVGTDTGRIVSEVERLLDEPAACAAMAHAVQLYGDGRAAARSVAAIAGHLGLPTPGERCAPLPVGAPADLS